MNPDSRPLSSYAYADSFVDSDMEDSDTESSIASVPPFSVHSVGTSRTSHGDVSMRSESPAPSVWSMTSSMRENAYKEEYGRGLNNYSDVYRLPADEEELERLDKQHDVFMRVMGKYPPPLDEAMREEPGETKAVLDLGCGSGSWIMDVARDYPHCSAVAVDLVPMQSPYMPPNLRSEVDDVNLGLEHFYGAFNVVHARLIASGIKDYASLVDQVSRCLRPGGLVEIMEFDFYVYDEDHRPIVLDPAVVAEPWWPRWLTYCRNAAAQSGGDVDAATHIHSWIEHHPAFEDVVYREFYIPTGPFEGDSDFERSVGEGIRDDIIAFLKSGKPLLLGSGVPEELVVELQENAEREVKESKQRMYIRLQNVYGRKKDILRW